MPLVDIDIPGEISFNLICYMSMYENLKCESFLPPTLGEHFHKARRVKNCSRQPSFRCLVGVGERSLASNGSPCPLPPHANRICISTDSVGK